jgi:hypothetical protein
MQDYALPRPSADRPDTLILFAALAPSSHNTQPWQFEVDGRVVRLYADQRHQLKVCDPDARELVISCGCALMNLRVAAAEAGCAVDLRLLPDDSAEDLLAELEVTPAADGERVDRALASLFPALFSRRTFRKRFNEQPVDPTLLARLAAAADTEGACFRVLDPAQRETAVELIIEGDELQWANSEWRTELASWMHPRRSGDGLVIPPFTETVAQTIIRSFDMGNGIAARDRQLAEGSPVLALFSSDRDDTEAWLQVGMALERVLLSAQLEQVQASYLNQPVQVPSLRPRVQAMVDSGGAAQVLLRMGYATERLHPTPRRTPGQVIRRSSRHAVV